MSKITQAITELKQRRAELSERLETTDRAISSLEELHRKQMKDCIATHCCNCLLHDINRNTCEYYADKADEIRRIYEEGE